jgi:hypothetical protein
MPPNIALYYLIHTSGNFLRHPFVQMQPIAAYLILVVAVVAILGKLSQLWSSVLLFGIQSTFDVLCLLYQTELKGAPLKYMKAIRKDIPKTIRQVREKLQLTPPPYKLYACCPNNRCSKIYEPLSTGGWPEICMGLLPGSTSTRCLTSLLHHVTDPNDPTVNRHPIRPYLLYDIKVQIAELATLEPTASQLFQGPFKEEFDETSITDILFGQLVRSFDGPVQGPNGSCHFFDSPAGEKRLLFTLSVDWMNPGGVKAHGPAVSVGVIALCCINLPISIRYRPENLILVGIIPGPREPPLDTINYFLKPVVDDFLILWERGLRLEGSLCSDAQTVRAAIIALVTDMPASKKIAGSLSHHADAFCSLCLLKRKEMANIDRAMWPRRSCETHRKSAFAWLNATPEERRKLGKESGVRWSELFRLPYWDPTRQVVVDIMHNLFLGLIKRHYTTILGMSTDSKKTEGGGYLYQQPDPEKVKAGRRILNSRLPESVATSLLKKCTWPTLFALCIECGVSLKLVRRENTKLSMANELEEWVSVNHFAHYQLLTLIRLLSDNRRHQDCLQLTLPPLFWNSHLIPVRARLFKEI